MPSRNCVNIINFIRAVEPRLEMDLVEPLREQIKLVQSNGLKASWLLQYDAMIEPAYRDLLLKELDDSQEIGIWFEVVQPLVEKAGLQWRGRYPWDWHTDVGFSVGYTPGEREKLADVFMEDFHHTFGAYPKTVGSWLFDAHLLAYLSDRYGIIGACNCKDQWGTDGYTLWGGYYNQAYYPSRFNSFMPAQTEANQIPVPVFRMLGSDPIYQYDLDMLDEHARQGVVTLEPVYANNGGGGDPQWVRWFFDVNFRAPSLAFGYTQVGQENSFGWKSMKDGLIDQVQLLVEETAKGNLTVETLAESSAWFRDRHPVTPATAITALSDWKKEGRKSVWYNSRHYRMNLFAEAGDFRIRDIHLFDETYAERYLDQACLEPVCYYDTLPIMDGARWSAKQSKAGVRPVIIDKQGKTVPLKVSADTVTVEEESEDTLRASADVEGGSPVNFVLAPNTITVQSDTPDWALSMVWSDREGLPSITAGSQSIQYEYHGFSYALTCLAGTIQENEQNSKEIVILPQNGEIVFSLENL
ncbi:hypothetical protein M3223_04510 [Paenibacillus pasadenensis]|uniref:hypothetical protein n=1 Tax=Paenibacillus pasadenensis TaxID=217090 RepID=UPI0020406B37|nr:hypothetical protein [Paenibacillus pasadenensis]MCM3746611.1 hypothetical protein [Paenibacillus pasadenensis]